MRIYWLRVLLGGFLADRILGYRRSIVLGAILMALGEFALTLPGFGIIDKSTAALYGALGLIIIGNGFFKPNISTMVGSLYKPSDARRDSAFKVPTGTPSSRATADRVPAVCLSHPGAQRMSAAHCSSWHVEPSGLAASGLRSDAAHLPGREPRSAIDCRRPRTGHLLTRHTLREVDADSPAQR
jgi:hypothetical protein